MTNYAVSSGQVSSGVTLQSGDQMVVYAGGLATQIVVDAGGLIYVDGGMTSGDVLSGGSEEIGSNGVAIGTDLLASGIQTVDYLGLASGTLVASGGGQVIDGTAIDTTVLGGGTMYIDMGTASGTVLSGGRLTVGPGTADASTILAGGTLFDTYFGTSFDTAINAGGFEEVGIDGTADGTMILAGGVQQVDRAGSEIGMNAGEGYASGTIVGSGGIQRIEGTTDNGFIFAGGIASATVVLSGGTQQVLGDPNTIDGTYLSVGGTIDLASFQDTSGADVALNAATDLLTVTAGGQVDDVQLAGDYTGQYFHVSSDGAGGTDVTLDGTPCYCRGTRILTETGEVLIEDLRVGDRVATASGAVRPLRWIGRRSYGGRFAAGNRSVLPICFRAGSLGQGRPRRDLFVSPLHAMFLDGVLIPAWLLINQDTITQAETVDQVDYLHLELDSHDVILAEGAPSETYVDDANRGMFHNAAEYEVAMPGAPRTAAIYCAPRIEEGEVLETIRRRLAGAPPPEPRGALRGQIDLVEPGRLAGWALDDGPGPVRLRIAADGVPLGEIVAAGHRADVAASQGGDGRCGFDWTIPGGMSPDTSHTLTVRRAADGADLLGSPCALPARPTGQTGGAPALRGQIDRADCGEVLGWADDAEGPVWLIIVVDGTARARILANRWRADVAYAGIADGRRAFAHRFIPPLAALAGHVVEVRRERDGAALDGTVSIPPAMQFGATLRQAVEQAVASASEPERAAMRTFLLAQADRLIDRAA